MTRDRTMLVIDEFKRANGRSPLQKEIAFGANICRGNVLRSLKQLKADGRITQFRSEIIITPVGQQWLADAQRQALEVRG